MITHEELVDIFGEEGVTVFGDTELPALICGQAREFLTTVGLPRTIEDVFELGIPAEVEVQGHRLCYLGLGWNELFPLYLDPATGEVDTRSTYDPDRPRQFLNSSVAQLAEFLRQAELLIRSGTSGLEETELWQSLDESVAVMTAVDPPAVEHGTFWGNSIVDMELQVTRPGEYPDHAP